MTNIEINRPKFEDVELINEFFQVVIIDTFKRNGISNLVDSMTEEIEDKRRCLNQDIESDGKNRFFLIAKENHKIVGSIEYGPSNELIISCTNGELKELVEIGTVFVHPGYQNKGIGSRLLNLIFEELEKNSIKECCLDSGYKTSQKIWINKFGNPQYHLKDYWGEDGDHMIWRINVEEVIKKPMEKLEKVLQEKIHKDIKNFQLKSKSSNQLYFFDEGNNQLVLKTPNMALSELSPFWKQLQNIFGSDFITQTDNITSLAKYLYTNPHIKVPKVFYTDIEDGVFQVFERIEGASYEPDEFPIEKEINYQLGQYIGWIHSQKLQGYGIFSDNLKLKSTSKFVEDVLCSMDSIINEYWSSNQEVIDYFRNIQSVIPKDLGSFSLIMPDISANQFVYSKDLKRINAVVDIDAYVIGPINFELTVLEMCLSDNSSFKKGYEEYCELPCFKSFRSFYRFLIYLNDPQDSIELKDFLNTNILFP